MQKSFSDSQRKNLMAKLFAAAFSAVVGLTVISSGFGQTPEKLLGKTEFQPEAKFDLYFQELINNRATGNQKGEIDALFKLMNYFSELKKPDVAAFYGKQAVGLENLTRDMFGGSDSASGGNPHRVLADILISQGRLSEAEQTLDLLKRKEESNVIVRQTNVVSLSYNSYEAQWKKQLEKLIADTLLAEKEIESSSIGKSGDAKKEKLLSELRARQAQIKNEVKQFHIAIAEAQNSHAPQRSVETTNTTEKLQAALKLLGAGTVAITTISAENKQFIIFLTQNFKKAYTVEIEAKLLNQKIMQFWHTLQNPRLDPLPLAQELYKILIKPLEKDLLAANAKTIMWSVDGIFRFVPVSALHDSKTYLVERFRNVNYTFLNGQDTETLTGKRRDVPLKILGLGVAGAQPGFNALPAVREELFGIIKDEKSSALNGIFSGKILLDNAFTLQAMKSELRNRYAVVHLASHFVYEADNPKNSAFLIGDGSLLSISQLTQFKGAPEQLFGGVELLTLAACNTALSGGDDNGSGGESFSVLLQRLGAKSVLMSKWSVADESTGLLMQKFYKLWASSANLSKIDALRQAQISMLKGEIKMPEASRIRRSRAASEVVTFDGSRRHKLFEFDSNAPYAHPYYWSPFVLIGNWR